MGCDKYRIALLVSAHAPENPHGPSPRASPSSLSIFSLAPSRAMGEESNLTRKLCHILINLAMSPAVA